MSKYKTVIWPKVILFGDSITQVRSCMEIYCNIVHFVRCYLIINSHYLLFCELMVLMVFLSVFISSQWVGLRNCQQTSKVSSHLMSLDLSRIFNIIPLSASVLYIHMAVILYLARNFDQYLNPAFNFPSESVTLWTEDSLATTPDGPKLFFLVSSTVRAQQTTTLQLSLPSLAPTTVPWKVQLLWPEVHPLYW